MFHKQTKNTAIEKKIQEMSHIELKKLEDILVQQIYCMQKHEDGQSMNKAYNLLLETVKKHLHKYSSGKISG